MTGRQISFCVGVPRCVRMDDGTENVLIEDIEKAFRWEHIDDMAADKSVLRGSSHSNQVSESAKIYMEKTERNL